MDLNKYAAKRLKAARLRLIKGWCKGAFAKDENGEPSSVEDAAQFCALGALQGLPIEPPAGGGYGIARDYLLLLVPTTVVNYNDARRRTKEDIISLYDWAIGAAEAGIEVY